MRLFCIVLCVVLIGCSSAQNKSVFQSGWNNETNEAVFIECGACRPSKGVYFQQNLDRLVGLGVLNAEQAMRAAKGDVLPGDPECLAYAALGYNRKGIGVKKNAEGIVIEKFVTYSCDDSDAPCPGIKVIFADGKVTSVSVIR